MKKVEYKLEYYRIIFDDEFFLLIRENALSEKTKRISINYSEIEYIQYLPSEIFFGETILWSILYFWTDLSSGKPMRGKNEGIRLQFKNGQARLIETDGIRMSTIDKVINECSKYGINKKSQESEVKIIIKNPEQLEKERKEFNEARKSNVVLEAIVKWVVIVSISALIIGFILTK